MSGSKRVNRDKLAIRRHRMETDTSLVANLVVHNWMVANLVVDHWMVANLVVRHWMVANLVVHQCWMGINVVLQGRAVDSQGVERRLDRCLYWVNGLKSIGRLLWGVCQCYRELGRLRISECDRDMVNI